MRAAGQPGGVVGIALDHGAYNAVLIGGAALVLWRAGADRRDRAAWGVLGAGLLLAALGDLVSLAGVGHPGPSVADALWLASYPCAYVAVLLFVRARTRDVRAGAWLDGVVAALGAATLAAAVLVEAVRAWVGGGAAAAAVNLAYPLGDAVLLGVVVGLVAASGWRVDRMWALVLAAILAIAVADVGYLVAAARGATAQEAPLAPLWGVAVLLLAAAAWLRPGPPVRLPGGERALMAPTAVATLGAVVVLVVDHYRRLDGVAVLLAATTLVAVLVRATLAFSENARMVSHLDALARTDPLTGLGNRRALQEDLEPALAGSAVRDWMLVILDLDGFKVYNDTFGHPAGDALLRRLGTRLAEVLPEGGTAYRLGGDEFCALVPLAGVDTEALVHAAAAALDEAGEGFTIRASLGAVFLPEEAATVPEALRVADRRLYANKRGRRASADGQAQSALLQAIQEREPGLQDHVEGVVTLAVEVARRVGLDAVAVEEVGRAAALHDVGKLAVPDAILRKPGPLSPSETALMRAHTLVGERILAAAPALGGVSRLVRSSHERWDGAGYPDGLAGEDIPLGARIVAVCDAFDAMTSDRCYRSARPVDEALAEIVRCAGTQFDPRVAAVLGEVVRERAGARPPP